MIKIGTFIHIFDTDWLKFTKPLLKGNFDHFELMLENDQVYSVFELKKILNNRETIIHAPFVEANLISNNEIIRKSSLKYYTKLLTQLKSAFNPKVITMHIGYAAFFYKNINLDQFKELTCKFPNIAFENMPDNKSIWRIAYPNTETEFDNLLKEISNGITFDVGHWLKQGYDIYKLLQKYSKRIVNIHIHDVVEGKDHQILGSGILNLEKFIQLLKRNNYNGYLTIELIPENPEGIIHSFNLLRKIIKNVYN